ncbi:MAG: hypothetical protein IPK72_18145 [Candidatus Eisenbacteria bacterium]|nr:hypothetical protein [Candidatus Eisenbacteria bacterium]
MAGFDFGGLVKAVVDLERSVMLIDAEMHSDQEAELIATGSNQASLWGINLSIRISRQTLGSSSIR